MTGADRGDGAPPAAAGAHPPPDGGAARARHGSGGNACVSACLYSEADIRWAKRPPMSGMESPCPVRSVATVGRTVRAT